MRMCLAGGLFELNPCVAPLAAVPRRNITAFAEASTAASANARQTNASLLPKLEPPALPCTY